MIRRLGEAAACALLLWGAPASAQTPLTLAEAIARARTGSAETRAAETGRREAEARLDQARAGYFPRIEFHEAWQRGNQPVYAFGTLLNQRRFTEANFAIGRLTHPDPVTNHRAGLMVDQLLFDGGAREAGVRAARLGTEAASAAHERAAQDVARAVTGAFALVLTSRAAERAAAAAIDTAEADLRRARDRHESGLVTLADVLALEVHLARMREARLSADAEARAARVELNRLIGAPLDEATPLAIASAPEAGPLDVAALEAEALERRPEVRLAGIEVASADAARARARAGLLPQVAALGGVEWNGASFGDRASSWMAAAEVRINLFRGFEDRARIAEAHARRQRAGIEREAAADRVRVDVRGAVARLDAARAREAVGRASVAQARESERIIRDRYDNGLADVTALLRAADAVVAAEAQETAARVDVLVHRAAVDRAVGR